MVEYVSSVHFVVAPRPVSGRERCETRSDVERSKYTYLADHVAAFLTFASPAAKFMISAGLCV